MLFFRNETRKDVAPLRVFVCDTRSVREIEFQRYLGFGTVVRNLLDSREVRRMLNRRKEMSRLGDGHGDDRSARGLITTNEVSRAICQP